MVGVEPKPYSRCQVQSVVRIGISSKERACADSEVVQALRNRVADRCRGLRREIIAYYYRIPAGHNEQLVRCQLCLAHAIELTGVCGVISEPLGLNHRLDRPKGSRSGACAIINKD